MEKRKVAVVVASRANYARVKYLMKAIKESPDLELQLIAGASTLLYRFGKAIDVIKKDGFEAIKKLYYVVEGETLTTQAKTTGLGVIELATLFEDLQPDIVVTVADRFETMATAIAASYQNIPLAHLQGGEISGNIDDKVRHAITKLADVHFVATKKAEERVIKMGEDPSFVFNFGCPSMDILFHEDLKINNDIMSQYGGTGAVIIDWTKPYILMLQHPVTTSYGQGSEQVDQTLEAIKNFKDIQKVVLWPNIDAGTDDVSKSIRVFREKNMNENFHYYRNFSPEDYARVLNNCVCAVGNSSSFIREGAFLGAPAVIVGDRQEGREHADNVAFCGYNKEEISTEIKKQIEHGKYESNKLFGRGDAGERIARKLTEIRFGKKRLTY
ncbi:MAG: UDP-N-acetylglucosamine 2-epimerase [Patescibacteria group bacterium]